MSITPQKVPLKCRTQPVQPQTVSALISVRVRSLTLSSFEGAKGKFKTLFQQENSTIKNTERALDCEIIVFTELNDKVQPVEDCSLTVKRSL